MKPTIPEVLPLIREYLSKEGNGTGGDYHILLDDGNVSDGDVEFCLDWARKNKDELGIKIGKLLLRMSKTQRLKLASFTYEE